MYTANTMAADIEAMGFSLPYNSSNPAKGIEKEKEAEKAGKAVVELIKKDLTPSKIITKRSMENAMVLATVLGGSTNAVLHFLAIAKTANIDLTLDDLKAISERTPLLADLKPSGKYLMEDIHKIGGIPAVMKYLLEKGLLHGDCKTETGKTISENLAEDPA